MNLHERIATERAWNKGPGITEGEDIERAVFGTPKSMPGERVRNEYMPYEQALAYARERKGNPLEQPRFVKKLRALVAQYCNDSTVVARFVSAVGTPLDVYHGVDGFFELYNPDTKAIVAIATVDVSAREKELCKADVLLNARLDSEGLVVIDESEYTRVAIAIANKLNFKSAVANYKNSKRAA